MRKEDLTIQCAWCHAIKQADGSYAGHAEKVGTASHGIYPGCMGRVQRGEPTLVMPRSYAATH